MNYRRHHLVIDFINIIMRFLISYLIITMILHIIDPSSALHTLYLLPAPFISYWIMRYSKHVWSYVLLHLVLIAIYLIPITNIFFLIVYGLYLISLTILGYYLKAKVRDRVNTSLLVLILFVFLYLCGYLAKMPDMLQLCFVLAIVYTLLYILNMYLLNLGKFVYNHEHITNLPFQQIKNSNNVLIVFICGIFFLIMLLFSNIPLGSVLTFLGRLLIRFLKYLVSLLHFGEPEMVEEIPVEEEVFPPEENLPPAEPSYLMELLTTIFQWLVTILAIVAVVLLVLYLVYKIYQYFYLKGEEAVKDHVEFLSPFDKKERAKREHKQILRNLFGRSNNALIRKHFAKAVASNIDTKAKLPKSLTPSQLAEFVIAENTENNVSEAEKRAKLIDCYEKARYSNEECSKEEVQIVKNILK